MIRFTLVSTVFNEMKRLENTIADIENQTVKPDEVIITDAGSKDGTYERLLLWAQKSSLNIKILQRERCNVAQGRNLAIKNASHEVIVSTDFGCRFHPDWLKSIITPIIDGKALVVGGNFGVLEEELQTWSEKAAYICANGYKNKLEKSFIPSSRSIAYFKDVWKKVGGYPEELTLAGDDTTFGTNLREEGYDIHLVHEAYVYWLRPKTLIGYLNEAKRYGIGGAESRNRVNKRNVVINTIELIAKTALILTLPLFAFDIIDLNIINGVVFFCLVLVSFRNARKIVSNWLRLKSPKYNVQVLFSALFFFDASRIVYIYWYIKTLFRAGKGKSSLQT